jgi:hypothetical protein
MGHMEISRSIKIVRRLDKILLYSSDEGDLFQINEISAFILEKIRAGKNEGEIVFELEKETHEKEDIIKEDVKDFLGILKEKGIING